MNSVVNKKTSRVSRQIEGFSLVELLVVIGIIAIVAAILVPVFASVKEKGRQATSITNLEKIGSAMALFKLDKNTYPDVLFGYAHDPGTGVTNSMIDGFTTAQAAHEAHMYFPGLYPTYVKDPNVFTDPDNPTDVSSTDIIQNGANQTNPDGTLSGTMSPYLACLYKADAFDSSPLITGHDTLDDTMVIAPYIRRYQKAWTNLALATPAMASLPDYKRQLRFPNALGDTYVTCTTYHVNHGGKVLVLFLDGHAHTFDTSRFLAYGPDSDLMVSGGETVPHFWKMKPNSP